MYFHATEWPSHRGEWVCFTGGSSAASPSVCVGVGRRPHCTMPVSTAVFINEPINCQLCDCVPSLGGGVRGPRVRARHPPASVPQPTGHHRQEQGPWSPRRGLDWRIGQTLRTHSQGQARSVVISTETGRGCDRCLSGWTHALHTHTAVTGWTAPASKGGPEEAAPHTAALPALRQPRRHEAGAACPLWPRQQQDRRPMSGRKRSHPPGPGQSEVSDAWAPGRQLCGDSVTWGPAVAAMGTSARTLLTAPRQASRGDGLEWGPGLG